VKWSIDSADAYSVARVRHAVIDALRSMTTKEADFFTVETVLGELLGAEMERGHLALAVTIERSVGGPSVHIYTQGPAGISTTRGELREAIRSCAARVSRCRSNRARKARTCALTCPNSNQALGRLISGECRA
jgi:hypothetical protein